MAARLVDRLYWITDKHFALVQLHVYVLMQASRRFKDASICICGGTRTQREREKDRDIERERKEDVMVCGWGGHEREGDGS